MPTRLLSVLARSTTCHAKCFLQKSLHSADCSEHLLCEAAASGVGQPAPEVGDITGFAVNEAEAACRMGADDQQDFLDPASGITEESIDQWAIDIEAEYQSPDDDAELSLEDAEAAGATPGAVRVICEAPSAGPP